MNVLVRIGKFVKGVVLLPRFLLWVPARNFVISTMLARPARRAAEAFLREHAYIPNQLLMSLGFSEPSNLYLAAILRTDAELATFTYSGVLPELQKCFSNALATCWLPQSCLQAPCSVHSYEAILRKGWYVYFNT
jgi:hypothetical protein